MEITKIKITLAVCQYQDNPTFEAYAGGTFAELLGIVGVYLIFLIALWQIIQKSIMMGGTIADKLPTQIGAYLLNLYVLKIPVLCSSCTKPKMQS